MAELPDHLAIVYESYASLGRDSNGRPTWQEIVAFLDEHGIDDVDERRVWQLLFRVISAERSELQAVEFERREEEAKSKRRK